MTGSASSSKALWIVGGIISAGLVIYYIISRFNDITEKLDGIAGKLALPKPETAPIDVTPEPAAPAAVSAMVAQAEPVQDAESTSHSEKSSHSGQNGLKTFEKSAVTPLSHSDHSENDSAEQSESFSEWRHSDDFRAVTFHGKTFNLTLYQSRALQKLWKACQNHLPELHQDTILEGIESCSKRLRDVFKSNMEAFRTLIARGERKGSFKINL